MLDRLSFVGFLHCAVLVLVCHANPSVALVCLRDLDFLAVLDDDVLVVLFLAVLDVLRLRVPFLEFESFEVPRLFVLIDLYHLILGDPAHVQLCHLVLPSRAPVCKISVSAFILIRT